LTTNRIFFDTEFVERGYEYPLQLISIGAVKEDGSEFYAVAADGWKEEDCGEWVKANVLPHLEGDRLPRTIIRDALYDFCGVPTRYNRIERPEFWAYCCSYDWVLFCQLFGTMIELPEFWPRYCRDLKDFSVRVGNPTLPKQEGTVHNALEDARHHLAIYRFLTKIANEQDSSS
jgi:hypothetical protein